MSALNSNVTVSAFVPLAHPNQSGSYSLVIWRSLDRIRNRGETNIRLAFFCMLNGFLYILDFLALVSPHQKHSRLDAMPFAKPHGRTHLLYGYLPLHCV